MFSGLAVQCQAEKGHVEDPVDPPVHLERQVFRAMLTWPTPKGQPDLAVVLVDSDEDSKRASRLRRYRDALLCPIMVAVTVEELEAWLVADDACVGRVLGAELPTLANRRRCPPARPSTRHGRPSLAPRSVRWMHGSESQPNATWQSSKRCRPFTRLLKDLGG